MNADTASSIAYYEAPLPAFLDRELQRLYGNIFCSLRHHAQCGGLDRTALYAARQAGEFTSLFLLRREQRCLRVLNEGMRIDGPAVTEFADFAFARFGDVGSIMFNAVQAAIAALPYPCQRVDCLEDYVLSLPANEPAYYARLGKSTQRYLSRYLHKLRRELPACRFEVRTGDGIAEAEVRAILELQRRRMQEKRQPFHASEARVGRILQLVREAGFLGIFVMNGTLCAGTVNLQEGDNYFLDTVAHDPQFNDFRLGTLCCYLSVCECMRRGGRDYHFLWGEYDYKTRLQGVRRTLERIVIYRSRAQLVLDLPAVVRNGGIAVARRCRRRLQALEARPGRGYQLLGQALDAVRAIR